MKNEEVEVENLAYTKKEGYEYRISFLDIILYMKIKVEEYQNKNF